MSAAALAAVALVALLAVPCNAQQPSVKYVWNQLIPFGDWHNASCWLPQGVPGPDDIAIISGAWNVTVNITEPAGVQSFEVGRDCTLNVVSTTFKFTAPSYVDAGGALNVGPYSILVFARLDVRGSLEVLSDGRTNQTVLAGLLPPTTQNGLVTPTSQLNLYATTQFLGLPGVSYVNLTNLVVTNYGYLHLGGWDQTFLQIWMLEYSVINNTVGALFDMEQPPTSNKPYYYYVIAGWLSSPRIVNSGHWVLGGTHVSEVDLELHGPVTFLDQSATIDGHVLFGSKFVWNLTTANAGVNCAGYAVNIQEWQLVGPGSLRFMALGVGKQQYTRFETGRLELHTEVDMVGVKISPTFDLRLNPDARVRMMHYDNWGTADVVANVLDGVRLVNYGTLTLDADGWNSAAGDVLWLNNGATLVNDVAGILNLKAQSFNLTASSTEGARGSIVNKGTMNVTYGYWNRPANPPLQVPLFSNGTIHVWSGNFTLGAGLHLGRTQMADNADVLLATYARLGVSGTAPCVVESATVQAVDARWPGVFGQLDDGSTVTVNGLLSVRGAKYEWYGGTIAGPGTIMILQSGSFVAQTPVNATHPPQFSGRLNNYATVSVRGPFVATDGAWIANNQAGTVDIQQAGSIFFTPNSTWMNMGTGIWYYQTRVRPSGTTMVCAACWSN